MSGRPTAVDLKWSELCIDPDEVRIEQVAKPDLSPQEIKSEADARIVQLIRDDIIGSHCGAEVTGDDGIDQRRQEGRPRY